MAETRPSACWIPRTTRRVILIIIDALRFDFADTFIDVEPGEVHYHTHSMPKIGHILRNQPEKARLFEFIADPPTVTMQRLKALTTGGLPTFIDISSNFNSAKVREDNLLALSLRQGLHSVFMGDDTWMNLFPSDHHFLRSYPYPSFNVKDLHTVDNGCIKHLKTELNASDWNLLIAHFLGVDHVGHRYEANHPAMRNKLLQLDEVIADVIQEAESGPFANDTVVMVFGDHGMTPDGNHGGSSDQETSAALFIYSTASFFNTTQRAYETRDADSASCLSTAQMEIVTTNSKVPFWCSTRSSRSHDVPLHHGRVVQQVDIVPTIAFLLGVPIPFGNLGTIIPEVIVGASFSSVKQSPLSRLAFAVQVNSHQVIQYMGEYFGSADDDVTRLETKLRNADRLLAEAGQVGSLQGSAIDAYRNFLEEALSVCRRNWTMFDYPKMIVGIFFMVFAIVGNIVIFMNSDAGPSSSVARHGSNLFIRMRLVFSPDSSPIRIYVGCFFLLIPYFQGLFSNSFIVQERSVAHFLVVSALVMRFLSLLVSKRSGDLQGFFFSIAIACLGIRLLSSSGILSAFDKPPLQLLHVTSKSVSPVEFLASIATIIPKLVASTFPLFFIAFYVWMIIKKPSKSVAVIVMINTVCTVSYWVMDDGSRFQAYCAQVVFALTVSSWILLGICCIPLFHRWYFSSTYFPIAIISAICTFSLLGGCWFPFLLLVLFVCVAMVARVEDKSRTSDLDLLDGVTIFLLSIVFFHASGQSNSFATLHTEAAFIGFQTFSLWRGGIMLTLNTFASHFVLGLLVPFFTMIRRRGRVRTTWEEFNASVTNLTTMIVILYQMRALLSAVNVSLQRRHLMVWAIFAPKFIIDGLSSLVACLALSVSSVMTQKLTREKAA